jgi:undecaprenyl-diphosphatase
VAVRESADGFGFPSGHSAVAWALAVVIAAWLPPRWRWLPVTAAALVAAGRIDAGVHYPLDVVGGGLWGLTVGLVVVAATGPRGSAAGPPARHRAVVPGAGG